MRSASVRHDRKIATGGDWELATANRQKTERGSSAAGLLLRSAMLFPLSPRLLCCDFAVVDAVMLLLPRGRCTEKNITVMLAQ